MNLKLRVDVGKVDEDERVGAGLADDPLHDSVDDQHDVIMTNCSLKLSWLTSVLRQLSADKRLITQESYG